MWQRPGCFYLGNLCAPWHRVVHLEKNDAQPLFRERAQDPGIHITIMLQTNGFGSARARNTASKPNPTDVYDVVNNLVAQRLARRPLRMPTFLECVHCMPRDLHGLTGDQHVD